MQFGIVLYGGRGDELVRPGHAWAMISELERNQVPHETFWLPGHSLNAAIRFLDREMP